MPKKKHTLTYAQALNMNNALHAIKKTKFNKPNIDFHLNISENRETLSEGLKPFIDTNNQLLEQHGKKNDKGVLDMYRNENGQTEVRMEDAQAYQKEYDELVNKEKEYVLFSLSKMHFDKTDVDNETITALIPLFK